MKVGMIGVGEMGFHMARHSVDRGLEVYAYDVSAERLAAAAEKGAKSTSGLKELAQNVEAFVVCVRTDQQMEDVTKELAEVGKTGQLVIAAGTHSLDFMEDLAGIVTPKGLRIIDAPVVFGTRGAREGSLLSLCGGTEEDVEFGRPAMLGYSKGVEHVGPLGAGQLAKTCNNLLHWVFNVANYETISLAKRYGVDAQRMREVLLKCPSFNGTLDRWDTTTLAWQEKDMDFAMDLAQKGGLMLPLAGQVDQLVKKISAPDIKKLLYEAEATYLGQPVKAMSKDEGGL